MRLVLHNARVHTQADNLTVDSLVISGNRIDAVGNNLQHDPAYRSFPRKNLKGLTVVPGLVDAHTHIMYLALSLARVRLDGHPTLQACLNEIRRFAARLPKEAWVVGDGYSPDRFRVRREPNRLQLDTAVGGRPAFIYSKDQHSAWVSSRALEIAGIDVDTPNPKGGVIERLPDGSPSGILREGPAIRPVFERIPEPTNKEKNRLYDQALSIAWQQGVTGVHSFDSPEAFAFFESRAEQGTLGIRINYYPPARMLSALKRARVRYGEGDDFLRVAGIKIFADGSLGSQTALCFHPYDGSKGNYGVEVLTRKEMSAMAREAATLGLPCAVHAIGDKAVSNVLDALEHVSLRNGARHRIEHVQLIRPSDIRRMKQHRIVASMQPSHCPSDIGLIERYWSRRSRNAFVFRSMLEQGVDMAFGSDAPIEPLHPLAGIEAAVRRAAPNSRKIFHADQRLTPAEALFGFTVGPAIAAGQEDCRGYLLPGYPADFVILDADPLDVPPTRLHAVRPLATVVAGQVRYAAEPFSL